jgi:hypothetical protein
VLWMHAGQFLHRAAAAERSGKVRRAVQGLRVCTCVQRRCDKCRLILNFEDFLLAPTNPNRHHRMRGKMVYQSMQDTNDKSAGCTICARQQCVLQLCLQLVTTPAALTTSAVLLLPRSHRSSRSRSRSRSRSGNRNRGYSRDVVFKVSERTQSYLRREDQPAAAKPSALPAVAATATTTTTASGQPAKHPLHRSTASAAAAMVLNRWVLCRWSYATGAQAQVQCRDALAVASAAASLLLLIELCSKPHAAESICSSTASEQLCTLSRRH